MCVHGVRGASRACSAGSVVGGQQQGGQIRPSPAADPCVTQDARPWPVASSVSRAAAPTACVTSVKTPNSELFLSSPREPFRAGAPLSSEGFAGHPDRKFKHSIV